MFLTLSPPIQRRGEFRMANQDLGGNGGASSTAKRGLDSVEGERG